MDEIGAWDIGAAAVVAIVMAKMFLDHLAKRRNNKAEGVDFRQMAADIAWLREVHAKVDADGVPVWYVRRSLEEAVEKLAENIQVQGELLRDLVREVRTWSIEERRMPTGHRGKQS